MAWLGSRNPGRLVLAGLLAVAAPAAAFEGADFDPLELPASFDAANPIWAGSGTAFGSAPGFPTVSVGYTYEGEFLGVESVTVPFGTFPNAVLVEFMTNFDGEESVSRDWLVEGFGPVKSVGLVGDLYTQERTPTNVPEPSSVLGLPSGRALLLGPRRRTGLDSPR